MSSQYIEAVARSERRKARMHLNKIVDQAYEDLGLRNPTLRAGLLRGVEVAVARLKAPIPMPPPTPRKFKSIHDSPGMVDVSLSMDFSKVVREIDKMAHAMRDIGLTLKSTNVSLADLARIVGNDVLSDPYFKVPEDTRAPFYDECLRLLPSV